MRVRPDERVGEGDAAALLHDAREELEVHLVDDPGARRHDLEVVERALAPAQERVALAVALELELRVAEDRTPRGELVHLHRVIDDELDGKERIDLPRVAAQLVHRVAHCREVDDGRHAGEVLEEDAARREGDLLGGIGGRDPAGDRLDVGRRDAHAVLRSQDVLEKDPQRVREPEDVVARLQRLETEDLVRRAADVERRARAEAVGVSHHLRFKQLGTRQPPEPALRQRPASGIEVPRDRLRVRAPDPPCVGSEPLVADRAQVLRVRIEHVLAADLPGRVEERQPHPDGHLERRPALAVGLGEQRLVDQLQLRGCRQRLRVVAEIRERALQAFDLERRDVDQPRSRPARPLERREQVVDRRELGALREHARRLQLGHERVEVDARPPRHVGGAGEEPERREPEREDGAELDDVSARLSDCEPLRRRLVLVDHLGVRALDAAHQLDGDPQQVLRRRLVEPRRAHEAGQHELGRLVNRPSEGRGDGAEDSLG